MTHVLVLAFLVGATTLEASGDAIVRIGLFSHAGVIRALVLLGGGALLLGYGVMLNLAPQPFERVVGLYIATLFVVWQVISFIAFRSVPSLPILIGGALIVVGGLIVSFWGMTSQT
jgi:hypothetical protein